VAKEMAVWVEKPQVFLIHIARNEAEEIKREHRDMDTV
jgi:hypothetical protein